jgi:hypothetical protein
MWAKDNDFCKADELNCLLLSMYSSNSRSTSFCSQQNRTHIQIVFYEKKQALIHP